MGINAFFSRIISYGMISINNGVLLIWKDPNIFLERRTYVTFHFECYKALGQDFEDLMYVLGKMSGYNSSVTLGDIFGVGKDKIWSDNPKDSDNFTNGATQDGWGDVKITKYTDNTPKSFIEFEIIDKNLPTDIINAYKEKKDVKLHTYVTGILGGGCKYLSKTESDAYEKQCVVNNDSYTKCLVRGDNVEKELKSKILQDLKIDMKDLYSKSAPMYKSRKYEFKPSTAFKINFGDGSFKIKNYHGSVMVIISYCILHHALKRKLDAKKYQEILNKTSLAQCESLKKELINVKGFGFKSLQTILDDVSMFGYGKFEVIITGENNKTVWIYNKNNPVAKDYLTLFGKQENPVDDYLSSLFTNIFKTFFNLNVTCTEVNCIAKMNNSCEFKIIIE